jgi:SAM-dependent methyltransferase
MNLADWPGKDKRRAPRTWSNYAVRAPLLRWLREEGELAARAHGPTLRVLDVGCANKPYYPFFAACAKEYVGVDVVPGPEVDLIGGVEALPVPDASFDLVICTQVLEHVESPQRAVAELRRVTAPGGRVLASTHGVQAYHPSPGDYWRWTRTGLERLFRENASWSSVTVRPGSGTAACIAMLIAFYVNHFLRRVRLGAAGAGTTWLLNTLAEAADRRIQQLGGTGPGTLHANYHVVAEVER